MKSGEKIFRQMKQNSARVVHPTRRDFVKYHGKDSAVFSCDEFLEISYKKRTDTQALRAVRIRSLIYGELYIFCVRRESSKLGKKPIFRNE